MQLEVLVEEPSAEEALRHILPKVLRGRAKSKIVNLGSKYKLLKLLPARLAAYRVRIDDGEDLRILVLIDRDADDCVKLKKQLEQIVGAAGLPTKSHPDAAGRFLVVNRIMIEELEAWFIGDTDALRSAFPSLPPIRNARGIFNNPDNVQGGTWEALHRLLKRHGIYRSSYPKIEVARRVAPHLTIDA